MGSFENDDAADWVYELEEIDDLSLIVKTLDIITEGNIDYLEIPECSRAIAAAEVLAALKDADSSRVTIEVEAWLDAHRGMDWREHIPLALNAIDRIIESSELKEVWDDSDYSTDWYDVIRDLENRLRA